MGSTPYFAVVGSGIYAVERNQLSDREISAMIQKVLLIRCIRELLHE
ncbi:hypothetical protein SAMN05428952_105412 [Nitrosomonas sp. Nm132]|nr:hypothetical protein SAMN05428952_105412 [Nitrosomonas sp. Nm132]